MRVLKGSGNLKGFMRFGSITRVLVKHGLGDVAERLFRRDGGRKPKPLGSKESWLKSGFFSPHRIRLILEELGPSFTKLGQLMSTRADVFPPEYIEEFKKLQDQVPPVSFDEIKAIIEQELKQPLSEIFTEFKPESIAAASVAQVHLAQLSSGDTVAVKVVRPGIEKRIREDIRVMYYFAEKIENNFEIGAVIGIQNIVKEFERTVFRELDMLIEAGNIEKFAANFKESDDIYIAEVFWDHTTKSVLVMEHIAGIKMDQVETIEAHGIDPKAVALIGLHSFSRQLMEFGYFHADPHPGNTIVMYDGRVSLVDFGIIGYLDEEMMLRIANLFLGYAEHNYDMVMAALLDAELIDEETMDLKSFRSDLKDMSEPFYGRSLQTISVRDVYDQTMQLVLKYHIRLPRNLLLLFKTFMQTEALGKILGSDASILEITRPYAKKLLQRGYDAQKLLRSMEQDARAMGGYMRMIPKFAHDFFKKAAKGMQVEIRHRGFQEINQKIEKGVNRLTVGMVISASTIAAALILNSPEKVFEFTLDLFGQQTISITALLGLTGYVVATVLGIWLILAIFRSGRM